MRRAIALVAVALLLFAGWSLALGGTRGQPRTEASCTFVTQDGEILDGWCRDDGIDEIREIELKFLPSGP